MAQFDAMQQQIQQLQQEAETGKMANNLMSQFINAGAIQQTAE